MAKGTSAKVQAGEVSYELHSLGWKAFQNLCVTIAGEIWGQTIQGFFDTRDGGRDGAFYGKWTPTKNEAYEGSFTVQCKFTAKAGKTLKLADVDEELTKAKRLAQRGLADNYFLFTNSHLTGDSEEDLRESFQAIPGVRRFAGFGFERICRMIHESSRLRMLVPRIYGLGDLSQILDQRAYVQASEILSALGDDLRKFVITDAYRKSAKALVEHGFVLLLGEPACGKSTIAAALSLGALDEWGCSTVKVCDADDFVNHWNPHEPKQFFWVDDVFGPTQFEWASAAAWNRTFPHVVAAIRHGARVLFTSRDYIYRAARKHLKESALPIMKESQVVIHVEQLTKLERDQILYNHIRLGNQPVEFRRKIKPWLPAISAHKRFSPEIARRLGNPLFTRNLELSEKGLLTFVAEPVELLREVIRTIDPNSRSALALIFMRGGSLESPVSMSEEEQRAVTLLGGSFGGVSAAFNTLCESLLVQTIQNGDYSWQFKHPTIRDAFAAELVEDRELMEIYLTGTPVDKLFREITCGDVGIEGVKVIVPRDRYDSLLARLDTFDSSKWESKSALHRFLAYRCDREFLSRFIARQPQFISSLQVGSYLYAVSDVRVLVRLHEFEILPDPDRLRAVNRIGELAVDTPDSGFLIETIRPLIADQELKEILEKVRTTLLPNLPQTIGDWESDYARFYGRTDPESCFSELKSTLDDYLGVFSSDNDAVQQLKEAQETIEDVIKELLSEMPSEPDSDDYHGSGESLTSDPQERSIFEDVDA